MIRLIGRKLIIPQGDTGTFTIPIQGTMEQDDKALISIYDNLTHTTVLERQMVPDGENHTLTYEFKIDDTANIEPIDGIYGDNSRYTWDVTILRNALYDENQNLIHYDNADSYYAAFSLPPCVIKRVTRNV